MVLQAVGSIWNRIARDSSPSFAGGAGRVLREASRRRQLPRRTSWPLRVLRNGRCRRVRPHRLVGEMGGEGELINYAVSIVYLQICNSRRSASEARSALQSG